jgi:hypothetical protein
MQVLIQCRRGEVFRTRTFDVLTISGDRPLESSKVDSPVVVLGGLGWVAGERCHPSSTGSSLWLTPGLPGSHELRAAKAMSFVVPRVSPGGLAATKYCTVLIPTLANNSETKGTDPTESTGGYYAGWFVAHSNIANLKNLGPKDLSEGSYYRLSCMTRQPWRSDKDNVRAALEPFIAKTRAVERPIWTEAGLSRSERLVRGAWVQGCGYGC